MKKTLVSALDWGLGHTTRIIPIIKKLLDSGDEIIIGASKKQEAIYREFFPKIKIIHFPSSTPVYSKKSTQVFALAAFLPRFILSIFWEHFAVKKIIKQYSLEKIISDNRYGLYNNSVYSIIITHQLNIILPKRIKFLQLFINCLNRYAINNFNECWVPDFAPGESLSGKLSIPNKRITKPIIYKGLLSRFSLITSDHIENIPTLLIIISGPEKQRTEFEKAIIKALSKLEKSIEYLIIRGLPSENSNSIPHSINYCSAEKLKTYIEKSKYIICRSGYSTIMDLTYLNRTALLVPTPGQTEQEYLANYLSSENKFIMQKQDSLNINEAFHLL